jgi:hypothetical protein
MYFAKDPSINRGLREKKTIQSASISIPISIHREYSAANYEPYIHKPKDLFLNSKYITLCSPRG